jgi:regulator of protease activity HflC (stomatin/prohibitin superfamily)
MKSNYVTVHQTHRALLFEDGAFVRLLEPGRHRLRGVRGALFGARPEVIVTQVDVRERELTIKGQEILTADKVAIRVNIVVQFQVTDPKAAVLAVADYEARLYSDVQLAARRSLASMRLEEILTNRNRLSEEILGDVKEIAAHYGVTMQRADVKDLVFPGNLQDIMNKVLAAERLSEAQLIEARTRAQAQQIDAQARAEAEERAAAARAAATRLEAEADAEARRIRSAVDLAALRELEKAAGAFAQHPALLRLRELDALQSMAQSANARLYIDFQKRNLPQPETE